MAKRYKSKRANKKSLITKISDVIDHTPKIVLWLNIMSSFINELLKNRNIYIVAYIIYY